MRHAQPDKLDCRFQAYKNIVTHSVLTNKQLQKLNTPQPTTAISVLIHDLDGQLFHCSSGAPNILLGLDSSSMSE